MLRRNQKGQAMTEFALILPLLLLLLLGVVEAGRTIWAFITVQQAAREAARFAVTGRPYLDLNGGAALSYAEKEAICEGVATEADPFVTNAAPWECKPPNPRDPAEPVPVVLVGNDPSDDDAILWNPRVDAIKRVAIDIGSTLAVSRVCFTPDEYNTTGVGTCRETPGAFGVLIQGQVTTKTTTGTLVIYPQPVEDHPGLQGLNVQVNTFYNLQMITPIFDAIMGGRYIQLQGRVQLQNEGLDEAAGIVPPPPLGVPDADNDAISPNEDDDPNWSISAQNPNLPQSELLIVNLTHDPGTYDIYLQGTDGTLYRICSPVTVGISGNLTTNCPLLNVPIGPDWATTGPVPVANDYILFAAQTGTTNQDRVSWGSTVNVIPGSAPLVEVDGETPPETTIWAAGETVPIKLLFHDEVANDYDVKLFDPDGILLDDISLNHSGSDTDVIDWTVPNIGPDVCEAYLGNSDCIINSFVAGETTAIATTTVRINFPEITMSDPADQDTGAYVRGEVVNIFLHAHTPFRVYSTKIQPDGITGPTSQNTNQVGDTTQPLVWVIPDDCGGNTGFPDGMYQITSHSTDPSNSGTEIARSTPEFEVFTSPDPIVTIDGGQTWNAGTTIKIRVLRHTASTSHYLEFDGNRIDIAPGIDTFLTDGCGTQEIDFTIPPGTPEGDYTIASFLNDTGELQDDITITVLSTPFIEVLEGDTAMPGQTITIHGTSHVPNHSYSVIYADKFLFGALTDGDGTFTIPYDLSNLPTTPPPDFTDFNNLGVPYILKSQTVVPPISDVATTTLTIQGADLVVTQVNVAPVAPFSTTVPVEIVVQNVMPVTINQYVDVDLYNLQIPNPDPFGPTYLAGYNFPGDVKFWKNTVAPNEVFTFSHQISLDELGLKSIYGYADVSNNVFEGESLGEVANPNNINTAPLLVNCPASLATDPFDDAALTGWTKLDYGDGDGSGGAGASSASASGALTLTSGGSTTWQANDDNGGQLLLHQNGTFSSSFGLDVQVMLSHVDVTGMGTWAKAGLEIRDSLDPTSPRVTWGVSRNNGSSTQPRQVMQAGYRDTGDPMDWVGGQTYWLNNHTIDLDLPTAVPVWLRISRDPGPNGAFHFYYKQSATAPPALNDDEAQLTYWDDSTLAESVSVSGIGDSVVVGLFNSPYLANTAGTSNFDNFSISIADPALCADSNSDEAGQTFPPLFETCTQVLQNTSFEGGFPGGWQTPAIFADVSEWPGGIGSDNDAKTGFTSLKAETLINAGTTPRTPHFHQQFAMPDWVISGTTSLNLDLFRKVDPLGSPDPDDKFYVMVVTDPSDPYNTSLTQAAEVASGVSAGWGNPNLPSLLLNPGVNLETYANQTLYLYFYNDSNNSPFTTCNGGLCDTTFRFDDIELNVCTQEPAPAPDPTNPTQINGQLILNYSNGTSEALPFVKVWAYAQSPGAGEAPVYETFTIQNGEFNFFNLPPGTYTIFAQYNLVEGTQVETLSADTTVLLSASNGFDNPAPAFLSLFTLLPLP